MLPGADEELRGPGKRGAGERGSRAGAGREVGARRGVPQAQGLLGAPEGEERVVGDEGQLDVRVREVEDGVGGPAGLEEA